MKKISKQRRWSSYFSTISLSYHLNWKSLTYPFWYFLPDEDTGNLCRNVETLIKTFWNKKKLFLCVIHIARGENLTWMFELLFKKKKKEKRKKDQRHVKQ